MVKQKQDDVKQKEIVRMMQTKSLICVKICKNLQYVIWA